MWANQAYPVFNGDAGLLIAVMRASDQNFHSFVTLNRFHQITGEVAAFAGNFSKGTGILLAFPAAYCGC